MKSIRIIVETVVAAVQNGLAQRDTRRAARGAADLKAATAAVAAAVAADEAPAADAEAKASTEAGEAPAAKKKVVRAPRKAADGKSE